MLSNLREIKNIKVFLSLFLIFGVLVGFNISASATANDYNFTGGQQSWTVPAGVTSVQIEVWGAGSDSALGGYAKGTKAVTAGQVLYIFVGGANGYNGGGTGVYAPGGGASDVRIGGTALANRIIVAGGAGSSGEDGSGATGGTGGNGGGSSGGDGANGNSSSGGFGGNQSTGYALGVGENGESNFVSGGGGGGGYYGGFGGGGVSDSDGYSGAGGGGGSGYIGGVTSGTMSSGVRSGNGLVRLTFTGANQNPAISISAPSTPQTYYTTGGTITITGKVSDPDGNNVTVSATINGKTKSTTINNAPTTPPGADNYTLTWDVVADNITVGTYNGVSVSANDGAGGTASAALVILTVSSTPPAGSITTIANALLDEYNDNTPHDIRVMFKGAANETHIQEYRIIAARTSIAGSIDANTAAGYDNTKYVLEPVKGKSRLHLINLSLTQKNSEGNAIVNSTQYRVFVLAVAKTGYSHTLTSLGDITLDPNIPLTGLPAPTVMDAGNNNNASDLKVTFKRPKTEYDVQEYRIFVRNTSAPAFNLAAAVGNTNYKRVLVTDGTRYGFTVTLDNTIFDTRGIGNPIANGQTYEIYILAYMSKTGTAHILSSPSKQITLSALVPSALPIRSFSAVKMGSGHAGGNISVTFNEPTSVLNVQEYRIFIVTGAGTLDAATATSVNNTARYVKEDSTARGAAHTVTLAGLNTTYDGTALVSGDYKVYVLTVGKTSTYANRLIGPSRIVKLN